MVQIDGSIENLAGTVAATGIIFGIYFGPTGGAIPAPMAALTGAALGATMRAEGGATLTATDWWVPFHMTRLTNLTIGQMYWFDLANADVTNTGKCTFFNPTWVIVELP